MVEHIPQELDGENKRVHAEFHLPQHQLNPKGVYELPPTRGTKGPHPRTPPPDMGHTNKTNNQSKPTDKPASNTERTNMRTNGEIIRNATQITISEEDSTEEVMKKLNINFSKLHADFKIFDDDMNLSLKKH